MQLSDARARSLTQLSFNTNVELQGRIPDSNSVNGGHYTYVREESRLAPDDLVLTTGRGGVVPAERIKSIHVEPNRVDVTLKDGTFPDRASIAGLRVATKAYYYFAAARPVPVRYEPG